MGFKDFMRDYTLAGKAGLYGQGKQSTVQPRKDIPYESATKLFNYSDSLRRQYPYEGGKEYGGKLSAPMGQYEKQGQDILGGYLGQGTPKALTSATNYATDVLGGKYDPRQSPYYKSMKDQILRDSAETKSKLLHESAQGGMLHSDPRRIQTRKFAEQTQGNLSQLLGSIYESERDRMGQMVPQALALGKEAEAMPLRRVAAATSYGAIPREIEQEGLGREYQEWGRGQEARKFPYQLMQNLSGGSMNQYGNYAAQPYQPGSSTGDTMGQMAQMAMKVLPFLI